MSRNLLLRTLRKVLLVCIVFSPIAFAQSDPQPNDSGDERNLIVNSVYEALVGKSRDDKTAAVKTLLASDAPRKSIWIDALIAGEMYRDKETSELVIAKKNERLLDIYRADDGSLIDTVKKRRVKRISVDNRMRRELRNLLSTADLESSDPKKRLSAIQQLLKNPEAELAVRVGEIAESEKDPDIRSEMLTFVSITQLRSNDPSEQLSAMDTIKNSINPIVKSEVESLAIGSDNPDVMKAAQAVIEKMESKLAIYKATETLFFGLSLGSILVLAAIGLAITFGVMGVINMAHGELIMLGAYTTWAIQTLLPNHVQWSLLLAVPVAFIVSGGVGVLIERTVIRHLYGRPLETLLATFGISLLLQQFVRTVISSNNVAVSNPSWMSGSFVVNEALSFTTNRVVILLFCLVVFAVLFLFLKRSAFGLQMRAVAQNRRMANAMGIRSSRIDALTFGLGSGIAGIAGVALSQITNVGPNLGRDYIIDSFLVVVFGGVGNLWGTLLAGMSLGIFNKVLEPWAGAVLAKVLVLVFIILFIQKRPRGLFPQRGRAAEA